MAKKTIGKFKPVTNCQVKKIKTYSVKNRKSKVSVNDIASVTDKGQSFSGFLDSLPNILAASDIKEVAQRIVAAKKKGKVVALGMGAHVIKTGLAPLIIDLMERGIIDAVAMNGACIVHDFELAFTGQTSEEVDAVIESGKFGMAEETAKYLNGAIKKIEKEKAMTFGLGRAVGEMINSSKFPYKDLSILAAGARLDIPVTVHVAIGTDIVHLHPTMDGALTGEGSQRDFRIFSGVVRDLKDGVYINLGSAVIMPEIFLKALTLVRNLGADVKNITTVNMDFLQHYRPLTNVVRRPTMGKGSKGFSLTGHHEIMFPLLVATINELLPDVTEW